MTNGLFAIIILNELFENMFETFHARTLSMILEMNECV